MSSEKKRDETDAHREGNRALKRIGDILRRSFRHSDIAARYGGEECAVILPETEKGQTFIPDAADGAFGGVAVMEVVFVASLSDPGLLEAKPGAVATPAEKAMLMDGFGDAFLLAAGFAVVALLSGVLSSGKKKAHPSA